MGTEAQGPKLKGPDQDQTVYPTEKRKNAPVQCDRLTITSCGEHFLRVILNNYTNPQKHMLLTLNMKGKRVKISSCLLEANVSEENRQDNTQRAKTRSNPRAYTKLTTNY